MKSPPLLLSIWLLGSPSLGLAASTIDPANRYAWGADIGWLDSRPDVPNGAVIGEYVCSGHLYAANIGWLALGSGLPANGIQYQNNSAADYGVNRDAEGNLRGYAFGANIGWVSFEATGAPRVDLLTGKFSGSAWSANCGWISLSNAFAFVQTGSLAPGLDSDKDGIPDPWELIWFGNLTTANASSDYDGDGSTDRDEYLAGTSPLDPADNLRITSFTRTGTYNLLLWTSTPTRLYRVERRPAFDPSLPWETHLSFDLLGWNNVGFDNFGPQYFYRVRAVRPLMP